LKKDAFYTPVPLADYMAGLVLETPDIVADFASGDGALLSAAKRRFPAAALVATDICAKTVGTVRSCLPEALCSDCDFLAPDAREENPVLREAKGLISVALLNPPFSCRGGRKRLASISGKTVACSQAMAFVATALMYLADGGEVIALLPAGCLDAEKDCDIWNEIRAIARIEVLSSHGHKTFDDCSPRTCVVRIKKATGPTVSSGEERGQQSGGASSAGSVRIFRGRLQMHSAVSSNHRKAVSLIHSTQLRDARLLNSKTKVARQTCDVIMGPAVLIPRVGLPKKSKLVRLSVKKSVILSDCVIAICCDSEEAAQRLLDEMTDGWPAVERAYGGTGAPYITIRKLTTLLFDMKYTVTCHAKGSRQLHECINSAIHSRMQMSGQLMSPRLLEDATDDSKRKLSPAHKSVCSLPLRLM
jgi:hypothetical protein